MKAAKLGAVEQRWASQLALFDFEIAYCPGRKNGNADALSQQNFTGEEQRVVLEEMVPTATVNATSVFPEFQILDMQRLLEQNPIISQFKFYWSKGGGPDKRERKEEPKDTRELLRQWDKVEEFEGILHRLVADARGSWVKQLLLPQVLKQEVLSQLHDHQGHQGIDQMFKMVRQRFYWPGMYQDVQNFCKNCLC